MLLLLALGVPQRPLAALEADLADFEAALERSGQQKKEPPEPIYVSVDVRICSAIPKLERTFAHCKFVAEHRIEWLRCFEETVEKMAVDAAPDEARALCIKQHATEKEPEGPKECCKNDPPDCDKKWWINKVWDKTLSKTTEGLWGTTDDAVANPKQRERLLLSKLQVSLPPRVVPPRVVPPPRPSTPPFGQQAPPQSAATRSSPHSTPPSCIRWCASPASPGPTSMAASASWRRSTKLVGGTAWRCVPTARW